MPGKKASEEARRNQILRAAFRVAQTRGLDGLTVRLVAERASLSTGLILFHFKTRDQLLLALLDHVLETTTVLRHSVEIDKIEPPLERFVALLQREMDRLASEPKRMRLFFDFWTHGFSHTAIRDKMQAELERYREAFRAAAEEVLAAEGDRFAGVTPDALAAVGVSFIKGCAVQSMLQPRNFDISGYLAAVRGLMGEPAHRQDFADTTALQ